MSHLFNAKFVLGLVCLLSMMQLAHGQAVETQHLVWARYYLKVKVNERFTIHQELEDRAYYFPWRQHQFVGRTQLQMNLPNNWRTAAGFAYFLQSLPQDPFANEMQLQSELRPQIEFGNKQTLRPKWQLDHRYLTDFRIAEQKVGGFKFNSVRWRYRFQVNYSPLEVLTLTAFDEIFIQAGPTIGANIFDQNRIGAALLYRPIASVGIELSYFHWFQERASGTDFYSRHIVRFTIHHTINLKKK